MDYTPPARISEWIEDHGSHTFYHDLLYRELGPYGIAYYDWGTLFRLGVHQPITRYTPAEAVARIHKLGYEPTHHMDASPFKYLVVGIDIARELYLLLRATTYPDEILATPPSEAIKDPSDGWWADVIAIRKMGL